METLKNFFVKPDPAQQLRKCKSLINKNTRELDSHLRSLRQAENKTRTLIIQTSKSKHGTPGQVRLFAVELVRVRRQIQRLATSRAQLQSVGMQVQEAFSVRKIEGSIKASTSVMKDVNTLVRLPELTGTMRELSTELMKAGIIEEMQGEMFGLDEDADLVGEDDEEVDKVLEDVLSGGKEKTSTLPSAPVSEPAIPDLEQEADQENLDAMRQRLDMLKS